MVLLHLKGFSILISYNFLLVCAITLGLAKVFYIFPAQPAVQENAFSPVHLNWPFIDVALHHLHSFSSLQ